MIRFLLFIIVIVSFVLPLNGQSVDREKITEYFQNQQFEEAIDYLQPEYLKDSNNLQVLSYLGYAYYMNDVRRKAEPCFRKILSVDSNNIPANQWLANIYIGKNQFPEAVSYIRRLIRLVPGRASYYRLMGGIYRQQQLKDSALLYYQYAYQLSPDDPKNIIGYAENLIIDSNYKKADSILHIGLQKDSANLSYLKLLIQSSYNSKNYRGIIAPGEKLIDLGELSVKILPKLVFAYFSLYNYPDCIRVCEIMDSNSLATESTYYYEAISWAKLNNRVLSNQLLEKCLGFSISKTSELYYFSLARNYESIKNYKKAISCYDTAYYLFKNPLMLYYGGRLYDENLKDYKMAKKYYLKFLRVCHRETAEEKKLYRYAKKRLESLQ